MSTLKRIRALFPFPRLTPDALVVQLTAIYEAMKDNPAYPHPPVDWVVFKATIDTLAAALVATLDGSKKAIAELKRQRHEALKMVGLLAQYVQVNCNDDLATFMSSGFVPASYVRSTTQPLSPPSISKVQEGSNSGQLNVGITAVPRARSYELRYAALGPGGIPGQWSTVAITTVKVKTVIDSLTPGTVYAFQVRALGKLGYTDWSHSITRMCI